MRQSPLPSPRSMVEYADILICIAFEIKPIAVMSEERNADII